MASNWRALLFWIIRTFESFTFSKHVRKWFQIWLKSNTELEGGPSLTIYAANAVENNPQLMEPFCFCAGIILTAKIPNLSKSLHFIILSLHCWGGRKYYTYLNLFLSVKEPKAMVCCVMQQLDMLLRNFEKRRMFFYQFQTDCYQFGCSREF